jgi:hypothetical protein
MAEEYEYDQYGGHADIKNENGSISVPMLGCHKCPAAFYTPQARTAHIATLHPGENSGPSPDMIALARVRPELAESLGMTKEEAFAPQNVHEFNQQQKALKIGAEQASRQGELQRHPVYRPLTEALSSVSGLKAAALATAPKELHDDIRETADIAHQHLLQFGYHHAIGKSISDSHTHVFGAEQAMHRLVGYTQHGMTHRDDAPHDVVDNHIQKLLDFDEHGAPGWFE